MKIMAKFKCTDVSIELMKTYYSQVQDGNISNREGLAAKVYFRNLFGKKFVRFDQDVINSGLNYGYSIFRSLISSVIISKGYLPNLGLFHIGKTNMFNLSDDIIEVFRPIVDDYVRENLCDEIIFKEQHRKDLIRLTTKRIIFGDCTQTISNVIAMYFECILKCIQENNTEEFVAPDCIVRNDI